MAADAGKASRWRKLAAQARDAAEKITDPEAKRIMETIAKGYDRLAERAEGSKKGRK